MGRFKLHRRAFLAGLGGTAVSLPFLECMSGSRASAADGDSPRRFVLAFAGTSLGKDHDRFVPDREGPDYDLTRALAPLGDFGVQDAVTVVSGLQIPWDTGSGIPPGGRPREFHASTVGPLVSGVRADRRSPRPRGPTADQVVAEAISGDARFESLVYRVQADSYRGGGAKGRVSSAGDPIASPKLAYEQLFTGFEPDDPAEIAARRAKLEQDGSILDMVNERASRLRARLGRADRRRLERHFDEIRALERRIREVPEPTAQCSILPDPGDDDPVSISTRPSGSGDDKEIGYANEEERARVMTDLVHMALTCDLTRSVSLMYTYAQSYMNVQDLTGVRTDLHQLGHGSYSVEQMSDGIAWHVKHFARLVDELRETPEGDGSVLDHCALVFVTEAGHGYDPESGERGRSHSSENMAALIAGRAGGLAPGRHVRTDGAHPASVLVSAMNAVGVEGGLGEVDADIPELFG